MSWKSLAKSHDDLLWDCVEAYRKAHDEGGFRMEDVAQWSLDSGLLPPPYISAVRVLTHKLKQAARRRRFRDDQGRTVRKVLAAKIERVDAKGNRIIDVIWEYLHEMSLDYALTAFSQRDEIIEKQRLAATRDVHSALDNNPNVAGHDDQFKFKFMLEEPAVIVQEAMKETPMKLPLSADQIAANDTTLISKKKPR